MHPLIRPGIRVAVAAAALGLLFHFVPLSSVVEALAGLHPGYLAAGVFLQFVLRAVATVRMKVIADNQSIDLGHAALFRILLASQFYSMLLPGPIAGGGATWVKYVQQGSDGRAAAVAIVLNRGVAVLVMVTVGACAVFLDLREAQSWATAGAALAGAALLALAFVPWATSPGEGGPPPGSRARRAVRELAGRLLLFGRIPPAGKALVVLSSVVYEVVGAGVMWLFARAVGLDLPLLTVVWIRAALQLVLTLPLSVAGLGIREAGLVGLGALVGVPAAAAVTWSLTTFFGGLVVAAVGGLLEARGLADRLTRPDRRPRAEQGEVPVNGGSG